MKRPSLAPRLVGIVVGLALGLYYIGVQIIGWQPRDDDYRVSVEVPRSAGLFEDSEVTFRGVQVGTVERIDLAPQGVRLTLRIQHGRPMPKDSEARVRMLSALGENYVDVVPRTTGGPVLRDGDELATASVPVPVSDALASATKLLRSLDPDDLRVVQDLLADSFSGVGPELKTLVRTGDDLADALIEAEPGTRRLIVDGLDVLRAGRASGDDLSRLIASFERISQQVRSSDDDFDRLLREGGDAAVQIESLVREQSGAFRELLDGSGRIGRAVEAHETAIGELFRLLPTVSTRVSAVARRGAIHTRLSLNVGQPLCSYRSLPLPSTGGGATPQPCASGPGLLQRGPDR